MRLGSRTCPGATHRKPVQQLKLSMDCIVVRSACIGSTRKPCGASRTQRHRHGGWRRCRLCSGDASLVARLVQTCRRCVLLDRPVIFTIRTVCVTGSTVGRDRSRVLPHNRDRTVSGRSRHGGLRVGVVCVFSGALGPAAYSGTARPLMPNGRFHGCLQLNTWIVFDDQFAALAKEATPIRQFWAEGLSPLIRQHRM